MDRVALSGKKRERRLSTDVETKAAFSLCEGLTRQYESPAVQACSEVYQTMAGILWITVRYNPIFRWITPGRCLCIPARALHHQKCGRAHPPYDSFRLCRIFLCGDDGRCVDPV